jgi:hypothetical protein
VHILSPNANKSELNPGYVYFQLASVEVYMNTDVFHISTNLHVKYQQPVDQFVFETPFTKSGMAFTADMSEQCKRKTILVTESSFPSLESRLKVASRSEVLYYYLYYN